MMTIVAHHRPKGLVEIVNHNVQKRKDDRDYRQGIKDSKWNLHGKTLKIVAKSVPPFVSFNEDGSLGGMEGTMFSELAKQMNFSFEVEIPKDWPTIYSLGSNGSADVGLGGI